MTPTRRRKETYYFSTVNNERMGIPFYYRVGRNIQYMCPLLFRAKSTRTHSIKSIKYLRRKGRSLTFVKGYFIEYFQSTSNNIRRTHIFGLIGPELLYYCFAFTLCLLQDRTWVLQNLLVSAETFVCLSTWFR